MHHLRVGQYRTSRRQYRTSRRQYWTTRRQYLGLVLRRHPQYACLVYRPATLPGCTPAHPPPCWSRRVFARSRPVCARSRVVYVLGHVSLIC
eukprot:754469-Rhodomonas_salina.2